MSILSKEQHLVQSSLLFFPFFTNDFVVAIEGKKIYILQISEKRKIVSMKVNLEKIESNFVENNLRLFL